VVDMSARAVTARLRRVAALLADRGFVSKGVAMDVASVRARLRVMAALSDMCRRLGARAGPPAAPRRGDAS
jgi:hypothetical protein